MSQLPSRASPSGAETAGEAGTSGGQGAEPVAIPVSEITSGEFTAERADKYQGVKAKWHSAEDASLHFVTVGKGEPYDELKDEYDSEESARLAAENRLAELNREAKTGKLTAPANLSVCAEGFVRITGTRDALASGEWRVKKAEFTLDSAGLKMNLEF